MLNNMTLGRRLAVGFGICTAITAVFCIYALTQVAKLGHEQDEGAGRSQDALKALEASQLSDRAYGIVADMIINRNLEEGSKDWGEVKQQAQKQLEEVKAMADTDGERAAAEKGRSAWVSLVELVDRDLLPALKSGDAPAAKLSEIDGRIDDRKKEIQESLKLVSDAMAKEAAEADEEFDQTRKAIFFMGVCAAIAAIVFGASTAIGITRSVSKRVREIAAELAEGAAKVADTAGAVAATSSELSSAATEQASSIQETASSVEEVNAMVRKNADNAQASGRCSEQSRSAATRGKQVVEDMLDAMSQIDSANAQIGRQIEDSNREIAEIVKLITEIGEKTKVINEIVFQTRLLSFNASVEAARAGEHGKGFSVVAEEVGNLAQMSGNAAQEISEMLAGSIQRVETIVRETSAKVGGLLTEGKAKIEGGSQVARRTGEVLTEIVESVDQVSRMVSEIATASREQAQGVEEITKAVSQMDQVTQQNAAASHQAANASDSLSQQAESLRAGVKKLQALVEG